MKKIDKDARIAVYLRRSRDEEGVGADEVLRKHRERMQLFMHEKGYANIEYFEEVASGGSISGRPEFKRLLSKVEAGRYDVVAAIHEDRLSRGDEEDRGRIKNAFKSTGTLILTVDNRIIDYNDPNDVLMSGITGAFSEYEKQRILRRFKDGKAKSVQDGRPHSGTVAYGYFWNRHTKEAEINEEEAEVFRMIVDMYLKDNMSGEQIAERLNELGIPSKRGGYWYGEVVTSMLGNDFYAGKVYYKKYNTQTYVKEGEDIIRYMSILNDDPNTVISSKGKHTPLLTEFEHAEIVKRIEEKRTYITKNRMKGTKKRRLSGLVYCPHCGKCQSIPEQKSRAIHVRKCLKKSKTRTPECDKTRGIAEQVLFDVILADMEQYKKRLFEPKDTSEEEDASLHRMIRKHEEAIQKAEKRIEKSKELFMNDLIDMEEMKAEKSKVDAMIRSNESKLMELKQSHDYHDKVRQNQQRELWSAEEAERVFKEEMPPEVVNKILRKLIVRISYEYVGENEINVDIVYK